MRHKTTLDRPKARIIEKYGVTDELMIMKIQLEFPLTYKPGQYCTIGINGFERPCSIVSSPHEGSVELLIQLVEDGKLTQELWNLGVGYFVTTRPNAKGVFTLDSDYKNHFMIATVTGIAPIVSMVRNHIFMGQNSNRFYILHGPSDKKELAYFHELETFSRNRDDIYYIPTLSKPDEEVNEAWSGERGRVNLIVDKNIGALPLNPDDTIAYACGNPGMVNDIKERLENKGYKVKEEKYWRV